MPKTSKTWYQRERRRRITQLMARDGDRCMICGELLDRKLEDTHAAKYVTFDHMVPRSLGGLNHLSNLRLAHRRCNKLRGVDPIMPEDEEAARAH